MTKDLPPKKGQNVNSYCDLTSDPDRTKSAEIVSGFKTVYKRRVGGARFAELLGTFVLTFSNARADGQ